ncbi:hypothetical protein [Acidocella sp.]|uniref:hypothetical protein n=1 Tax=Acidocella sp. TaxID=50710 RepID=UPI0026310E6D|nr:hypothetical protein [Acidocella sp.]
MISIPERIFSKISVESKQQTLNLTVSLPIEGGVKSHLSGDVAQLAGDKKVALPKGSFSKEFDDLTKIDGQKKKVDLVKPEGNQNSSTTEGKKPVYASTMVAIQHADYVKKSIQNNDIKIKLTSNNVEEAAGNVPPPVEEGKKAVKIPGHLFDLKPEKKEQEKKTEKNHERSGQILPVIHPSMIDEAVGRKTDTQLSGAPYAVQTHVSGFYQADVKGAGNQDKSTSGVFIVKNQEEKSYKAEAVSVNSGKDTSNVNSITLNVTVPEVGEALVKVVVSNNNVSINIQSNSHHLLDFNHAETASDKKAGANLQYDIGNQGFGRDFGEQDKKKDRIGVEKNFRMKSKEFNIDNQDLIKYA